MIWVAVLAWLVCSFMMGTPLARLALQKEKRFAVTLAFGVLAGHCIQFLLLLTLWAFMPLGTALYPVLTLSLLAAAASAREASRRRLPIRLAWGLTGLETVLVGGLVALLTFLGHRSFSVAYSFSDSEALFWRSGVTSWMTRGLYPPTNPLEMADPLLYRYGLNVIAAAFSSATGGLATDAVAWTMGLLSALMGLAFVGASCRALGQPGPGILAAVLGMLGGSLLWCLRVAEFAMGGADLSIQKQEIFAGLLWGTNNFLMVGANASVAAGYFAFPVALWLLWEATVPRGVKPSILVLALAFVGLSYLGLFYEVFFAATLGSLMGSVCLLLVISKWNAGTLNSMQNVAIAALLGALSCAAVLWKGGLLGGMPIAGHEQRSMGMVLNTLHFGDVIIPVSKSVSGWHPLLTVDAFVDTDFILVGLPVLMVLAWRAVNWYAILGLGASCASLLAWLLVYPESYPQSAYHFGQAALASYVSLAPFALYSRRLKAAWLSARVGFTVSVTLPILLIGPALVVATWMTVSPPSPTRALPGNPDFLVSQYLRQSTGTSSVLIPLSNPDRGWTDLFSNTGTGAAIKEIVALSAHSVPIGFSPDFHAYSPSAGLYRQASLTFDEHSLNALRIDWVYVLPAHMTSDRMSRVYEAIERGRLGEVWRLGEPGTDQERVLLRVALDPGSQHDPAGPRIDQ